MRSMLSAAVPLLVLTVWLCPADPARAGAPYLVADLGLEPPSSSPSDFFEIGGRLFFVADRQLSGRELWVTDGTAEGTRMVKDIAPGAERSDPLGLVALGDRLFFSATDPDHGRELWTSDGTEEGTVLVLDVRPGADDGLSRYSFNGRLAAVGGRLVFSAYDALHGTEPWVSDGTAEGTRILKDIEPATSSSPEYFRVWGDRLLFVAYTRAYGRELWITDGTADGTRLLLDVNPGESSGTVLSRILARGDRFYFEGFDGSRHDVWVSDGSPEGTSRLSLSSTHLPDGPRLVGFAGDRLIVTSRYSNGLWAGNDGDFEHLAHLREVFYPVAAGDELFFGADDGTHGNELWSTDGTPEGTRLRVDLAPGDRRSSDPRPFLFEGGRLWLTTRHGSGLWVVDAADVATQLASSVREPGWGLGRLWFGGIDDVHGRELWSSDATPEGTGLVRDVNDQGSLSWQEVARFLPLDHRMLLFTSNQLWVTDGSEAGTFQVPGPEELYHLRSGRTRPRLGDRIFFVADTGLSGEEVWWTDGTRMELLADPNPGDANARIFGPESTGRRLVFGFGDGDAVELWGSDGESAERLIRLLRQPSGDTHGGKKFHPEPAIYPVVEIQPLGEAVLVFLGWTLLDGTRQETLWRSDGTAPGTVRLTGVRRPFHTSSAAVGGRVYYFQLGELGEHELWSSDGRGAGTRRVAALPGDVVATRRLQGAGERVVFAADRGGRGSERWWISDGSAAGTRQIFDLEARQVKAAGGRLYVEAWADPHRQRYQLWQLDADTLEVEQVLDLDGRAAMTSWGEVLYYSREGALWRTDGTPEGTARLGGPVPRNEWFPPTSAAGGLLYFQADDGLTGLETWALAPECIESREVLCLGRGRFQARSRWRTPQGGTGAGRARPLGSVSGTFSFFGDDFPEIAVNVLDGRALNDHFWALSGAATDVEVDLRLFDLGTGAERRHVHPAGDVSSIADFRAFADAPDAFVDAFRGAALPAPAGPIRVETRQEAAGDCREDAATLCLTGRRFAVSVEWLDPAGRTGAGAGRQLTDAAGSFVFFGGDQLELLVKVLDGRALNGRFWVETRAKLTDLASHLARLRERLDRGSLAPSPTRSHHPTAATRPLPGSPRPCPNRPAVRCRLSWYSPCSVWRPPRAPARGSTPRSSAASTTCWRA